MNCQAELCANGHPFNLPVASQEINWRASITHKDASGAYEKSSAAREAEIARIRQNIEDEILGHGAFVGKGDTPPIEFISEDGVKETYRSHSDGANHEMTVIEVSNMSPGAKVEEGILKGTLLTPVSGHTRNLNDINEWAKNDTYTVRYEISDDSGTKFASAYGDKGKALLHDVKSLGYVSANELNIPLVKGRVTRIYYFRSGSGGPSGYFDGRVIDFVWK
jgi:hypothetical protein